LLRLGNNSIRVAQTADQQSPSSRLNAKSKQAIDLGALRDFIFSEHAKKPDRLSGAGNNDNKLFLNHLDT
jgi:hypothetical protein